MEIGIGANRRALNDAELENTRHMYESLMIHDPLVRLEPFQDDTQMSLVQYYHLHVLQMANTPPFSLMCQTLCGKMTVCHEIRNRQTSRNSAGSPSEFPKAINTRVSMQIASGRSKQLHDNIVQLI